MYPHLAHVFLDGGYLRAVAKDLSRVYINPRHLGQGLVRNGKVQDWASNPVAGTNALCGRITYYDALPDPSTANPELEDYWKQIELLDDVHLGFGELRGLKRRIRQKGVDTLIAVDMLSGAFTKSFDIAILVAGDADFVPVVEAVKRQGVMVALAAHQPSASDDLIRAADRFIQLNGDADVFPAFHGKDGKNWHP